MVGGSIGGGCWWKVVMVAVADTQLPGIRDWEGGCALSSPPEMQ